MSKQGLPSKWGAILKVTNVCKFTNADETWNLRLKWPGHQSREGDPALLELQYVEISVETPVDSASAKRGSGAVADNEERARLRLRAESNESCIQDVLDPQAKTKARLQPRRGSEA